MPSTRVAGAFCFNFWMNVFRPFSRCLLFLGLCAVLSPVAANQSQTTVPSSRPTVMLGALSGYLGKPVIWLGAAPTPAEVALAAQASDDSIENVGEWLNRWGLEVGVTAEASPEALVLRRVGSFRDAAGSTASSQFIESEKLQLSLMEALPDRILARTPAWESSALAQGYGIDAAHETFPLALLEAEKPGFEAQLRTFLQVFNVRAQGERELNSHTFTYDVSLHEASTDRLRLSLTAHTDALCRVKDAKVLLRLPANQECSTQGCFLALPAAPLLGRLRTFSTHKSDVVQGELGSVLAKGAAKGEKLVVDQRVGHTLLLIASPRPLNAQSLYQTLEKTVGLQRRQVADITYLTLASDEYTYRTHTLVNRWQMARDVTPISVFQKRFNRPQWVKVSELSWPERRELVTSFRQWAQQNPQSAEAISEDELIANGEVWLARAVTLHLLLVEPATAEHPMVPLKHYPIMLHGTSPPA